MPEFVDYLEPVYRDLEAAGVVPDERGSYFRGGDFDTQYLPVILDWLEHYRKRFDDPWAFFDFAQFAGQSMGAVYGPHAVLAEALIREYWALVEKGEDYFRGIDPDPKMRVEYLLSIYAFGISDAATSEQFDLVRELIVDPRTRDRTQPLIDGYLRRCKDPGVPRLLQEVLEFEIPEVKPRGILMVQAYAIQTAAARNFIEILPAVEVAADRFMALTDDDSGYFETRRIVPDRVLKLRKVQYAKGRERTPTSELIAALEIPAERAFAAYTLGVRKAVEALPALTPHINSTDTPTRQEAKTAVKKLENHVAKTNR